MCVVDRWANGSSTQKLKDKFTVFWSRQVNNYERWSSRGRPWPRGHIWKPLALASKVKSLASKPQVLENCPVLGLRTTLFFEWLKFCRSAEKKFLDRFCSRSPETLL